MRLKENQSWSQSSSPGCSTMMPHRLSHVILPTIVQESWLTLCSEHLEINTKHRPLQTHESTSAAHECSASSKEPGHSAPRFTNQLPLWALCSSDGFFLISWHPLLWISLKVNFKFKSFFLQKQHYRTLSMCQVPCWVLGMQSWVSPGPSFKDLAVEKNRKINEYSQVS